MTNQEINENNKELGRLSFRIDNKTREEWKLKRKARGFSDWFEYFTFLINSDTGNMMDEKTSMDLNELKALKELNKALLNQVQLLTEQLKDFNYLTQLETLNAKLNNHINTPKMEIIKEKLLTIIHKAEKPLTVFTIHDELEREDISEIEILTALTDLVETKKIKLNFHNQTYQKLEE